MTATPKVSRMLALALAGSVLAGPMLAGPLLAATKKAAPKAAPAPAETGLTREEARKHAGEIFDTLDFNHDGVFNAADGKARREARLGAMFDRLDTNHDGQVTKAEFIAAHEAPRGPQGAPPHGDMPSPPPGADGTGPMDHGPMDHGPGNGPRRGPGGDEAGRMAFSPMVFEILHEADPQHSGSVTKEAFITAELKRFDAADANHDGKVTREEMHMARHDERRDHHGWGRGPDRDGPHHGGPDHGWGPGPDHGGPDHGGPDDHGPGHGPRGDMPPPPPATPQPAPTPDAAK